MNSRRARFIAVQVLLTVALTGVIVVTLLDPKNEVSLFAVDVPGESETVAGGPASTEPPQGGDRREDGRGANPGRRGSDGGSGRADGAPGAADEAGGAVAPPPTGTAGAVESPPLTRPPAPGDVPPTASDEKPPAAPEDDAPTAPDDEQYGDTLTRLGDAVD